MEPNRVGVCLAPSACLSYFLLCGSTDVGGKCCTQKFRVRSYSFLRQRLEASFLQILTLGAATWRMPTGLDFPFVLGCSESAFRYTDYPSLKQ